MVIYFPHTTYKGLVVEGADLLDSSVAGERVGLLRKT